MKSPVSWVISRPAKTWLALVAAGLQKVGAGARLSRRTT
jgi:hypothetical protein